jgi:hypothetical protein
MSDFPPFPRDPKSAFDHITGDAIRASVLRLAEGMEDEIARRNEHFLLARNPALFGWNVVDVLNAGALCAFVKGIDPETDYDAALVRQALIDHGLAPRALDGRLGMG